MKKTTFLNALVFSFCAILVHNSSIAQNVSIKLNIEKQRIRGFGGVDFPLWIGALTQGQIDTAFGNDEGQLGLSILRINVPHKISNWSINIDNARLAIRHGAIVFASPWTPPIEMKTNNNNIGGKLRTDKYGAYANYLKTYYNYMNANGIPLYAISIQNEPDYKPNYDSCSWSIEEFKTFLDNNASVIPTRVMGPETIHAKDSWQNALESSPELDILATHGYGGPANRHLTTNKEQWMTEHFTPNSDQDSADRWPEALLVGEEINEYMVDGYNAYVWWYIRRHYGLIKEDGNVSKRGYVMGHYSKFVRPGSVRVDATTTPTDGVTTSAYKRGDSLIVIAINNNNAAKNITFNLNGTKVESMTKYETTSTSNISNLGTLPGGTSISNSLTGHSISTYVGKISNSNLGLENEIDEIDEIDEILMYPNPVSEILSIYLPGNENKSTTLSIYNTNGSLIKTITAKNGDNKLDIKKLTNGLYFIVFNLNNKIYSRKFVKN